ncbi:hypothetical protein IEQ34_008636 [Dendrobium chrysotoxum]|uniref:Uncharacterized protein n=1 Tax=Dendrobium chrysotoxum TaxID=161865 RepID=A0AAV7GYB6_DENCH|nr:hypothetical protein IEQ34_008636 [Dendrobium chrysotoxum]
MSLNCLLCDNGGSPAINREPGKHQCCRCYGLQRSFSANSSPPLHNKLRGRNSSLESSRRKGRHKFANSVRTLSKKFVKHTVVPSAMGEPRLMRSGGMRRDWSFEDLRNRRNARKH